MVFSPFKADTGYLLPSSKDFMINLAVDDLDGVLERCAKHGVRPVKRFEDDANGRFAHVLDPDGTKIELWQPRPATP
jgi:predicted enzyme related to lactoylglutathione lyase